ncbi:hypothetical protein CAEBREN_11437 [Caenorhabditis brenneri]|uniref:Uncharacterized protein n=1 Tax=Caenorhabditis brenneri TaxID=135651 RepID=G0NCA9_CAEBE|nr:hypothetical protein CAEBREN_11437 [Caenorhabditis brenneri]
MIRRRPKYRHNIPMPKNPNRDDLVVIDAEWIAKNSLKRISNPHRTAAGLNTWDSYASIDLKQHWLVSKHLEEQYR